MMSSTIAPGRSRWIFLAPTLLLLLSCRASRQDPLTWQEIVAADSYEDYLPVLDPTGSCSEYLDRYRDGGGLASRQRLLAFTGCDLKPEHNTRPHPDYQITKIVVERGLTLLKPRRATPMSAESLSILGLPVKEATRVDRWGLQWTRAFDNPCQPQAPSSGPCSPIGVHFRSRDASGLIDDILLDFSGESTPETLPVQMPDRVLPRSAFPHNLASPDPDDAIALHVTHRQLLLDGEPIADRSALKARGSLERLHGPLSKVITHHKQEAALRRAPFDNISVIHATRMASAGELSALLDALDGLDLTRIKLAVASQPGALPFDPPRANLRVINMTIKSRPPQAAPSTESGDLGVDFKGNPVEPELPPFKLVVKVKLDGLDLHLQGQRQPPIDGCPSDGPTICLRAPGSMPSTLFSQAATSDALGDYSAATALLELALASYDWTGFYNEVVTLKAAWREETVVYIDPDPEVPVALVVQVLDGLRAVRRGQGRACGQRLEAAGALGAAEPCESSSGAQPYEALFPDTVWWLHAP